jgi:hypothetical protein
VPEGRRDGDRKSGRESIGGDTKNAEGMSGERFCPQFLRIEVQIL